MLIALSGYARSGKDTFADILVDEYGFKRIAFADKLRECVYALNPYVVSESSLNTLPLQEVINHYGWNGYKNTPWGSDVRRILQNMGTEVGRDILGENIWVDTTMNSLSPEDDVVITDCRFPNEASAVSDRDGAVVRIKRPGVVPVNGHSSETALDEYEFDYEVINDTTIKNLEKFAADIITCERHVNYSAEVVSKEIKRVKDKIINDALNEAVKKLFPKE